MRVEVLAADEWTPQEAADYCARPWQAAVVSIIETGLRLKEARKHVGHGQWLKAVELMPFGRQAASRLMMIADHPDLANGAHAHHLPASWYTLSVLAQLPEGELPQRIEAGEITPELTRRDAEQLTAIYVAANQEALNMWSAACDGLTAALAYTVDFTPPANIPENYASISDFIERARKLLDNIEKWESAE